MQNPLSSPGFSLLYFCIRKPKGMQIKLPDFSWQPKPIIRPGKVDFCIKAESLWSASTAPLEMYGELGVMPSQCFDPLA